MTDPSIVDSLERIIISGVALTTVSVSRAAIGLDLTLPQWRVLVVLGDRPQGAIVSDIASWIGVTLPATSRLLRRLERRGIVALAPDERDRRATRVRLTDHGADLRASVIAHRRARIAEIAASVPADPGLIRELAALAEAFERRP